VLLFAEEKTYFIERLAGRYLNWRNSNRVAWGTYWEREARNRELTRRVEAETAETRRLHRAAQMVHTFPELIKIIPEGVGVSITPDKFVELYRTIPAPLRPAVIPPKELVRIYWSDEWRRTSIWVKGGGCTAFLVDDRNRMIRDIKIKRSLFEAAENYGKRISGQITSITEFTGSVFPGDKFLKLMVDMSDANRYALFTDPEILLVIPKPLTRVGLAATDEPGGIGSVGFESSDADGPFVLIYPALNAGINRLLWELTWTESETLFTPANPEPDTLPDSTFETIRTPL